MKFNKFNPLGDLPENDASNHDIISARQQFYFDDDDDDNDDNRMKWKFTGDPCFAVFITFQKTALKLNIEIMSRRTKWVYELSVHMEFEKTD